MEMDFLKRILAEKKREVAAMPTETVRPKQSRPSFYETLRNNPHQMHLIAEIKRASPSKGTINQEVDILDQAKNYQAGGAAAISVLTDPVFFKGQIEDLRQVAEAVTVPVLCKDFIISKKQLVRAKNAGASMVLLIVAAISSAKLKELYTEAKKMGLEVLVETHNQKELKAAQKLGAKIIGVNNRNLKTFEVSIDTSVALAPCESETIYISESGFKNANDVQKVTADFHGVLVGETLMRSKNIQEKMQELQVSRYG